MAIYVDAASCQGDAEVLVQWGSPPAAADKRITFGGVDATILEWLGVSPNIFARCRVPKPAGPGAVEVRLLSASAGVNDLAGSFTWLAEQRQFWLRNLNDAHAFMLEQPAAPNAAWNPTFATSEQHGLSPHRTGGSSHFAGGRWNVFPLSGATTRSGFRAGTSRALFGVRSIPAQQIRFVGALRHLGNAGGTADAWNIWIRRPSTGAKVGTIYDNTGAADARRPAGVITNDGQTRWVIGTDTTQEVTGIQDGDVIVAECGFKGPTDGNTLRPTVAADGGVPGAHNSLTSALDAGVWGFELELDIWAPLLSLDSVSPASAPVTGAAPVTLTGVGFAAGATVAFGGTPATEVVVVSETEITCRAPAHAPGAVNVSVTVGADTATLVASFTYLAPQVTSVTPSSGPAGAPTPVTIAGANFAAPAVVSFGGTPATDVVIVSDTEITCTAPARATGVVDVVVTVGATPGTLADAFEYLDPFRLEAVVPSVLHLSGGVVELAGAGFEEGHHVLVGGVASPSVTVVGPELLEVVAPGVAAGAAVDITVLKSDGTSRTLAGALTYEAVALDAVDPASLTTDGGLLTLTGRWFFAPALAFIEGVPVATTRISGTELEIDVPPLDPGRYDVAVSSGAVGYDDEALLVDGLLVAMPTSEGRVVVFVVT